MRSTCIRLQDFYLFVAMYPLFIAHVFVLVGPVQQSEAHSLGCSRLSGSYACFVVICGPREKKTVADTDRCKGSILILFKGENNSTQSNENTI